MAEKSRLLELNAALEQSGGFVLTTGPGGAGAKFSAWLAGQFDARMTVEHASWVPGEQGGAAATFFGAGSRSELPEFALTTDLAVLCARELFGLSAAGAEALVARFGPATCLFDSVEVAAETVAEDGRLDDRFSAAVRATAGFGADFKALADHGGNRLLDLARAIYLLTPEGMHLGDEWTELASVASGRCWSLSDASLILSEYGTLFEISASEGPATVNPRDAYCELLFAGMIPASASEYHKLFAWMLSRTVDSLVRSDDGDSFVRRSLPRVAASAGVLEELLADGQAMLASDIDTLVGHIEADPELMTVPGAKAILLHAHRLGSRVSQREAQMEFALRRLGLTSEADQLEQVMPPRLWRPTWSSTRPVNVHRVLCEVGSSAISMGLSGAGREFRAYVGFGNGQVIQASLNGECSQLSTTETSESEVRAVAVAEIDQADLVVTASSDSGVRAYRVRNSGSSVRSELLWTEIEGAADPLSAVAIVHVAGTPKYVVAAGVKGRLWKHDLMTGGPLDHLLDWAAEIRTIRTLTIGGRSVAVVAAVDGRVGIIDCESGKELGVANVEFVIPTLDAVLTPISLDAVVKNERVFVLVGCATGHVLQGEWSQSSGFDLAELHHEGVRLASANSVKLVNVDGELAAYVARSDGVWLRHLENAADPLLVRVGHAGPVLSLNVTKDPVSDELIVLTGGSEGAVRVWRQSEEVEEKLGHLRVNRHRGAVTSLAIHAHEDDVEIATGGADGDVRLWRRSDPASSRILRDQGGEIASLVWLATEPGSRLIVGASDGSVRTASLVAPDTEADDGLRSQLIGIAHEGVTVLTHGESGQFLSAGADGGVTLWDGEAGVPRSTIPVFEFGAVSALVQSGATLFVAGQDGTVRAVDQRSHVVTKSSWRMSSIASMARIDQTGDLVLGFASGDVCLAGASRALDQAPQRIFNYDAGVEALATLQVDGEPMIAIAGRDRRVVVIDASTGIERYALDLEGFPNAIAADDNLLGVATTGGATLFEFSGRQLRQSEIVADS